MSTITRFFHKISTSYFLFGPRGTGKSTLMHLLYPKAIWIDLLLPDVLRQYLSNPEHLANVVAARQDDDDIITIVIDEVQKAPKLLDVVHYLMEKHKKLQFILTGSSSRKLKSTGVDLLGGRAGRKILHPFMACELKEKFSLENALEYGTIPLIVNSANPHETLQAYIHLYLREEVQMEGLTRNLENFTRFLEAISFSHASLINLTNIARECNVKRKTVENYLEILEDLLLAFKIPVFSKRASRELTVHPKIYLFDTGVFQALRPKGILDHPEEIQGHALEGLVATHLRAWNDYSGGHNTISFWRTKSGVEVDFIIYGKDNFYALEVKNSKKIRPSDLKPLELFLQDYPMATAILLHRGRETWKEKNILCLPCSDFLQQLNPEKLKMYV